MRYERQVRIEDRFDEAVIIEPKKPICDDVATLDEVAQNDHASKSGHSPSRSSNTKNYREDVEIP